MTEETTAGRGAVAGQVERPVRPLAWTDERCKELDELGTLLRTVYDIGSVISERDIDGPPPAPFLRGYMPDETLRKIAHKMRRQARGDHEMPERRVSWMMRKMPTDPIESAATP